MKQPGSGTKKKGLWEEIIDFNEINYFFDILNILDVWQGSEYVWCWSLFFQIFHISKPRTLMQKKVRGDYTPRFFFFAKPAIYTIKKM